jgi:polysaccharide biosynthesis protein PslG
MRSRRTGVLAGAAGLALVAVAVLLSTVGRADPAARTERLQTGVTVFSMWRDWDRLDALLDRARDSGSPWVRVDIGWCSLEEAGPGVVSTWYRDRLDATVAGVAARGMRLLVDVGCAPGWAGGTAYDSYPSDPAQFERVMTGLAQRYRGRVAAWEIWNEPDCVAVPDCPGGDPAAFVPVLRAGFRGVRAGDPAATVVSGGISGNNADWIARMYRAGAGGWFDVLAVHPYLDPADAPPDAPSEGRTYRLTTLPAVRAEMVANGDAAKPIWFTEFGWTTASTGPRTGVDEATQATYLSRALDQIRTRYPYVTTAFWFCLRDRDDSTPYENAFGLLRVDGSAKPAFAALAAGNARLRATP